MQHSLCIVYKLGGDRGSLMYFEIKNQEDMKYLKFQSLKLHSAYLIFLMYVLNTTSPSYKSSSQMFSKFSIFSNMTLSKKGQGKFFWHKCQRSKL